VPTPAVTSTTSATSTGSPTTAPPCLATTTP
jgi:hypothetical protein